MNAQTNMDLLPRYAKSLVDLKPDVIVATGTAEADALKEITSQMKTPPPVIFMGILSPAKLGLADNITKLSGNLTGLDNYYLELLPKRLQLFHSLIPNIETIAVLGDKRILAYEEIQKTLLQVVEELPIDAEMVTVSTTQEIEEIFKDMGEKGNGGILLLPGFFIETSWEEIIMQANKLSDDQSRRFCLRLFVSWLKAEWSFDSTEFTYTRAKGGSQNVTSGIPLYVSNEVRFVATSSFGS